MNGIMSHQERKQKHPGSTGRKKGGKHSRKVESEDP